MTVSNVSLLAEQVRLDLGSLSIEGSHAKIQRHCAALSFLDLNMKKKTVSNGLSIQNLSFQCLWTGLLTPFCYLVIVTELASLDPQFSFTFADDVDDVMRP
jgi:hypothetical protein